MKHKYLIFGFSAVGAFLLGVLIFSTCNPISNKCLPNEKATNVAMAKNLNPVDFKSAIESGEYKLIDIRTSDEFNAGHIKGSVNTDFYKTQEFSNYLDGLDKNEKYLIYCRSGNRSGQALNIMRAKGFKNVSDLQGGINAWLANGFDVI